MGATAQRVLLGLNKLFVPPNRYFGAKTESETAAFAYSVRSGEVVYRQFHGFNDFRGKVVLDFGCGAGGKTMYYAQQGPRRVIGVDFGSDYRRAREHAARHRFPVEFRQFLPDGRIDVPDASVDVAISSSVLEHIMDLPAALGELQRVLKPGGLMLNRWHPFRSRFGGHIGAAIGVPFAHVLFREADVVQGYYRGVVERFNGVPQSEPKLRSDSVTFDDLEMSLNRKTSAQMHAAIGAAGFEIIERRFLVGTREVRYPHRLPTRIVDYAFDYEVHVARRNPA